MWEGYQRVRAVAQSEQKFNRDMERKLISLRARRGRRRVYGHTFKVLLEGYTETCPCLDTGVQVLSAS
jgi:uncharacterized membrane protein